MRGSLRIAAAATVAVVVWTVLPRAFSADTAPGEAQKSIQLPKASTTGGMSLVEAMAKRRSVRTFADKPLTQQQVADLCWAAQGITQEERGLRTAPSAMALYPIKVFIVDKTGLYEYQPKSHSLLRMAEGDMMQKLRAGNKQGPLNTAPACMIVTMNVQYMVPRCKDRAERYSLLEVGHVAQNVLLQATSLGLASVPMGGLDEAAVTQLMGLSPGLRTGYLLPIGYPAN